MEFRLITKCEDVLRGDFYCALDERKISEFANPKPRYMWQCELDRLGWRQLRFGIVMMRNGTFICTGSVTTEDCQGRVDSYSTHFPFGRMILLRKKSDGGMEGYAGQNIQSSLSGQFAVPLLVEAIDKYAAQLSNLPNQYVLSPGRLDSSGASLLLDILADSPDSSKSSN